MSDSEETRFEAELKRLSEDLQRLRLSCGEPTLDQVCDLTKVHGRAVAKSTASTLFAGKSLPSIDIYMVIVRAVLAYPQWQAEDGQPRQKGGALPGQSRHSLRLVPQNDPRLEEWRELWKNLRALQKGLVNPSETSSANDPNLKPPGWEPEGPTDEAEPPAPNALAEALGQQLTCLLSDDEQALLKSLAFPAPGARNGRIGLHQLAKTAAEHLPGANASHVTSVLRSLMARGFLQTSAEGSYVVSDAGRRALTRRMMQ